MRVPYRSAMITLDKYDSALHQELLANAEDYLLIKCFVHFQMRLHVKYIARVSQHAVHISRKYKTSK